MNHLDKGGSFSLENGKIVPTPVPESASVPDVPQAQPLGGSVTLVDGELVPTSEVATGDGSGTVLPPIPDDEPTTSPRYAGSSLSDVNE